MASKFNDKGVNALFKEIAQSFDFSISEEMDSLVAEREPKIKDAIIPAKQINYLRTISETVKSYNEETTR